MQLSSTQDLPSFIICADTGKVGMMRGNYMLSTINSYTPEVLCDAIARLSSLVPHPLTITLYGRNLLSEAIRRAVSGM